MGLSTIPCESLETVTMFVGFMETVIKAKRAMTRPCVWLYDGDELLGVHGDGLLGHVDLNNRHNCMLTLYRGTVGSCEHDHKLLRVHSGPRSSRRQ